MRFVGIYASYTSLLKGGLGQSLDLLQEHGVNTVIVGGGFNPSPSVEQLSPFGSQPGSSEALPGVAEECRGRGLKLWLVMGVAYAESISNPDAYPGLAVRDVYGNIVYPDRGLGFPWGASCCPSNASIRRYFTALFRDVAQRYDFDGVTLTHLRFSPPSHSLLNIFSCFCPSCVERASQLGYNPEEMRRALTRILEALKRVDASRLREFADANLGFFDMFQLLGPDRAVVDWFNFRCQLITESLAMFHAAAKEGRKGIVFSTDNYPPSFALLAGHNYRSIEKTGDFLSPLLNHPTIFQTMVFAEACKTLLDWNKGLSEEDVLKALYRVFGYDGFNLPTSIKRLLGTYKGGDTYETEVPLHELIHHEARKARMLSTGKPLFAVVEGHSRIAPEAIKRRIEAVRRAGLDGVAFVSFEDATPSGLEAIKEGLEAW